MMAAQVSSTFKSGPVLETDISQHRWIISLLNYTWWGESYYSTGVPIIYKFTVLVHIILALWFSYVFIKYGEMDKTYVLVGCFLLF